MADWLRMDIAPKHERILLSRPKRGVGIGKWEPQSHHNNPKPYWRDDREFFGVRADREDEPTGWMPLPEGMKLCE